MSCCNKKRKRKVFPDFSCSLRVWHWRKSFGTGSRVLGMQQWPICDFLLYYTWQNHSFEFQECLRLWKCCYNATGLQSSTYRAVPGMARQCYTVLDHQISHYQNAERKAVFVAKWRLKPFLMHRWVTSLHKMWISIHRTCTCGVDGRICGQTDQ